jgi:hypothetical protein
MSCALGYADPAVHICLPSALPPIPFGPDDAPIDVTKLAANDTNRQRILSCAKDTQSSIEFAESLHGCTFMRYLCLLENEFK